MQDITFFLQKYSSLGLKERQIKDSLIQAIKEVCGLEVDKSKVDIQKNKININVQGPEKAEIFMNNELIQKKFSNNLENFGHTVSEKRIF